jgi:copper chaperone CopZ
MAVLATPESEGRTMHSRTAFHLDCTPVIPECGFKCAKCVEEIKSVLTGMPGVERVYRGGKEEEGKLIVEHDPSRVTVEQLVDSLRDLPSFHEESFVPTVITA